VEIANSVGLRRGTLDERTVLVGALAGTSAEEGEKVGWLPPQVRESSCVWWTVALRRAHGTSSFFMAGRRPMRRQ
jgi:hypothetical protein